MTSTSEATTTAAAISLNISQGRVSKGTRRVKWSVEEEEALIEGVDRYGEGSWIAILQDEDFSETLKNRNNTQLKDKWRTISSQATRPLRSPLQKRREEVSLGEGQPVAIGMNVGITSTYNNRNNNNTHNDGDDLASATTVRTENKQQHTATTSRRILGHVTDLTSDEDEEREPQQQHIIPAASIQRRKERQSPSITNTARIRMLLAGTKAKPLKKDQCTQTSQLNVKIDQYDELQAIIRDFEDLNKEFTVFANSVSGHLPKVSEEYCEIQRRLQEVLKQTQSPNFNSSRTSAQSGQGFNSDNDDDDAHINPSSKSTQETIAAADQVQNGTSGEKSRADDHAEDASITGSASSSIRRSTRRKEPVNYKDGLYKNNSRSGSADSVQSETSSRRSSRIKSNAKINYTDKNTYKKSNRSGSADSVQSKTSSKRSSRGESKSDKKSSTVGTKRPRTENNLPTIPENKQQSSRPTRTERRGQRERQNI